MKPTYNHIRSVFLVKTRAGNVINRLLSKALTYKLNISFDYKLWQKCCYIGHLNVKFFTTFLLIITQTLNTSVVYEHQS